MEKACSIILMIMLPSHCKVDYSVLIKYLHPFKKKAIPFFMMKTLLFLVLIGMSLLSLTYFENVYAIDTVPPILIPNDMACDHTDLQYCMTVNAPNSAGVAVTFSVSARDDVDGILTPFCSPSSGSVFQVGQTYVNCTATDAAGNTGTVQFRVLVIAPTPIITTFSVDRTSYNIGDTIIVSGHIDNHFPNYPAIIDITAPNGPTVLEKSLTVDSNGDFGTKIVADPSIFVACINPRENLYDNCETRPLEGTYTIRVIHVAGSITASTQFNVIITPQDNTPPVSSTISVSTDRQSYGYGDLIVISGAVKLPEEGIPVNLTILDSNRKLVLIDQFNPAADGSYSRTYIATGPLWKAAGNYAVIAQYGSPNVVAETYFEFRSTGSQTTNIFEVNAGMAGTFDVGYTISGGTVNDMKIDHESFALVISINAINDGRITVNVPRALMDAKYGDEDDDFFVLIGGEEATYNEAKTSSTRTLTIQFLRGDRDIDIIGTKMVGIGGPVSTPTLPTPQSITVSTNKSFYSYGETIIISGETRDYISGVQLTVVITNPIGDRVYLDQVEVRTDRTYSTEISADTALWRYDGTYTVHVQYGSENRSNETTFEFTSSSGHITSPSPSISQQPQEPKQTPTPTPIPPSKVTISQVETEQVQKVLTDKEVVEKLASLFESKDVKFSEIKKVDNTRFQADADLEIKGKLFGVIPWNYKAKGILEYSDSTGQANWVKIDKPWWAFFIQK